MTPQRIELVVAVEACVGRLQFDKGLLEDAYPKVLLVQRMERGRVAPPGKAQEVVVHQQVTALSFGINPNHVSAVSPLSAFRRRLTIVVFKIERPPDRSRELRRQRREAAAKSAISHLALNHIPASYRPVRREELAAWHRRSPPPSPLGTVLLHGAALVSDPRSVHEMLYPRDPLGLSRRDEVADVLQRYDPGRVPPPADEVVRTLPDAELVVDERPAPRAARLVDPPERAFFVEPKAQVDFVLEPGERVRSVPGGPIPVGGCHGGSVIGRKGGLSARRVGPELDFLHGRLVEEQVRDHAGN
mmetsp:Transcript_24333/g.57838  ORF Transcript_24333/g.57838 Transcript_24333/m.57838 type:complete len:302 (+) Transcript_24333:798-1703(+)